ncbi:MAG: NAD-dependent epimerase/dehydratase family protein [Acidimicrobiia bacterium]|nr:NAD-dependent epimerase/dehydratase family protein [Acidimicrobiia bacterium]
MRVLVVGGTNFIGPEVVRALLRDGADVTVLHRGEHEDDLGDAVHVHADRGEVATVASEVRPEVILDMVPVHARHGREIVEAARIAGVRRVVAVSSVDTYRGYDVLHRRDRDVQPIPFRETDPVRQHRYPYRDQFEPGHPMHDYDKLDVEELVLAHPDESVVLRLPVVFGPKDFQHRLYPIVRRIADGMDVIVYSDSFGNWRFAKAYRSNVADAIALGCLHVDAAGIYNVCSFDGTEAEWARTVGHALDWDGEVVVIDDAEAPDALRHPDADLRQHLVPDASRIRDELGWSERVPLDEAIAVTAEWELANPPDEFTYDADLERAAAEPR